MLLLIVAVTVGVLIKGADWLVDGASGMAIRLGMPKVIVGATIVAMGTTSPECAVSVMAAWSGNPGLALGNAVGSIIADTALIFGVVCLLTRLPADRFVLKRHGWVQFGAGVLLAGVCYGAYLWRGDDAALGRPIGVLLLALLVVYMLISIRWSKAHVYGEPFQTPEEVSESTPVTPETDEQLKHHPMVLLLSIFVIGLLIVLVASRVLVCSATVLAHQWGVPQVVIAATLVALGTSLPELVVGIASITKGHKELLVGNIIGADVLNVLFVVGASAAAAQLPIVEDGQRIFLYLHLPAMLAVLLLFRLSAILAIKRGVFHRWHGAILLLCYVLYVVGQFVESHV